MIQHCPRRGSILLGTLKKAKIKDCSNKLRQLVAALGNTEKLLIARKIIKSMI